MTIDATDASFENDVLLRSDAVPVIVDLWAPWCGPCKALSPIIERVVDATGGAAELVKVNVDENPMIAQSFQVQSIPAVFAIKDRKIVDRFIGALPEADVHDFVARLLPAASEAEQLVAAGDEASLRRALELEPDLPAHGRRLGGDPRRTGGGRGSPEPAGQRSPTRARRGTSPLSPGSRSPARPWPRAPTAKAATRSWKGTWTLCWSGEVGRTGTPGACRPARDDGPLGPEARAIPQGAHGPAVLRESGRSQGAGGAQPGLVAPAPDPVGPRCSSLRPDDPGVGRGHPQSHHGLVLRPGLVFQPGPFLRACRGAGRQGADVLDVGGVKAGPGPEVSEEEELDRVMPVIASLRDRFDVPLSADTWRASVAAAAFEAGAVLGNDISGFADPAYLPAAARAGASVVATHIRLAPRVPDPEPHYDDLVGEVAGFLLDRAERALASGITADRIVLDAGLDLGKTARQSLTLLQSSAPSRLARLSAACCRRRTRPSSVSCSGLASTIAARPPWPRRPWASQVAAGWSACTTWPAPARSVTCWRRSSSRPRPTTTAGPSRARSGETGAPPRQRPPRATRLGASVHERPSPDEPSPTRPASLSSKAPSRCLSIAVSPDFSPSSTRRAASKVRRPRDRSRTTSRRWP